MAAELKLIRADGSLVLVSAVTDKKDRAYALYRVETNGMPEEYYVYMARLFSKTSEGGIVMPGAGSGPTIKTEVFDKLSLAIKRCEEWVDVKIEVPELAEQPS